MPLSHIVLAIFVALIWGYNFVAIRVGLNTYPPFLFSALRFATASLPFLPFLGGPGIAWRWIVQIGTVLGVVYFAFLFVGMAMGVPAGLGGALCQTQAFFTIGFGMLVLKEKPSLKGLLGSALAFGGVILIADNLSGGNVIAFLLIIGSAACMGYSNILTRQSKAPDALRLMVWVSAFAVVPHLLLSLIFEGPHRIRDAILASSWASIGAVLYVGFAATILGFGIWSFLLKRYPAATVAPYSLLVPLFSLSSAALWLGERPNMMQISGVILIIAGLGANSWPPRVSANDG